MAVNSEYWILGNSVENMCTCVSKGNDVNRTTLNRHINWIWRIDRGIEMPTTTETTKKKKDFFSFLISKKKTKYKRISLEWFRMLLSVFAEWSQVQTQELSAHNAKRYTMKYISTMDMCVCVYFFISLSLPLSIAIRFMCCVVLVLNEHVKLFKNALEHLEYKMLKDEDSAE